MAQLIDLHGTAMGEFDRRVREVRLTDWALPTPCDEWDVHDLVNHLTTEQLWVPPLLGGERIEEVGDRLDGDNLGEEPITTWEVASRESRASWLAPSSLESTVHLSFGDVPGEVYLWQMTFDLTVHAWDLARALGVDETLDPDLVKGVHTWASGQGFGPGPMFDAPAEVGPEASPQDRLIALTGRKP